MFVTKSSNFDSLSIIKWKNVYLIELFILNPSYCVIFPTGDK